MGKGKGKFYCVGVGPGDPELMSVKAIRIISESHVIAVPASGSDINTALKIAGQYLENKRIITCDMPMLRDKKELDTYHNRAAVQIMECLNCDEDVAFLTLGDPSVYSTAMYLHKIIKNKGYQTGMIPGITSFCAAAAAADISLCEGGEPLVIVPASYGDIDVFLELPGTKILMKSGKSLAKVKDTIKKYSNKSTVMVEKASMIDECVYRGIDSINDNAGYFTVLIVKDDVANDEVTGEKESEK